MPVYFAFRSEITLKSLFLLNNLVKLAREMQTLFRQIPKHSATVFSKEPAKKIVLRRPKFNLMAGFIVLILTGLVAAHFLTGDKNQKKVTFIPENERPYSIYLGRA